MPIWVVTKKIRYIHELSLTLEHSISISSPAVPGLTHAASWLAKEIEQKLDGKSGSTRTQIDFNPNSTRVETLLARPVFGLRNASSAYQRMIKSIYSSYEASLNQTACAENFSATASRGALIFDAYSESDESSHDNLDPIINATLDAGAPS